MKPILFTLEKCVKCEATKEYLKDIKHEVVVFPHSYKAWTDEQKRMAEEFGVLDDLKVVAPVLVIPHNEHTVVIGQLRIKKWVSATLSDAD